MLRHPMEVPKISYPVCLGMPTQDLKMVSAPFLWTGGEGHHDIRQFRLASLGCLPEDPFERFVFQEK